jgi:hypothetical protein
VHFPTKILFVWDVKKRHSTHSSQLSIQKSLLTFIPTNQIMP